MTFIIIHDLTHNARILYSSDSIVDILGHTPDEVVGKSYWGFIHPGKVQDAKALYAGGVQFDKAAVLSNPWIRNRQGDWVCCECFFSVVYDVMVCCIRIYRGDVAFQKRAIEASIVHNFFSYSRKDRSYYMLTHHSTALRKEPRATLFLNRFTRALTIMYASPGVEQITGISGDSMKGRSFYYCIQESCLEEAIRCLESAKKYDSISYLRFWFRDPRLDNEVEPSGGPGVLSPQSSLLASTAAGAIELKAVLSCTSDGLVVCLSRTYPAACGQPMSYVPAMSHLFYLTNPP